ncbi:MAG: hypothetical protein Q9165_002757 [Trypethelium subeluteriae]
MPHIEELPTAKSANVAPGWAYVPDTGYDPSKAAINPTHPRKRLARDAPGLSAASGSELTARQQTAIQRHIAELDRDSGKDVQIPVPTRKEATRGSRGKMTPNVKRILQSQKTFANHLADEEAMLAMQPPKAPTVAALNPRAILGRPRRSSLDKRRQKVEEARHARPIKKGKRRTMSSQSATPALEIPSAIATPSVLPDNSTTPQATIATRDIDPDESLLHPLLQTELPTPPSYLEIHELLSKSPLSYSAARVGPPPSNAPPQRHFCEICGYWGRVKCMKCGARVCSLACRSAHDDSRCLKFYA